MNQVSSAACASGDSKVPGDSKMQRGLRTRVLAQASQTSARISSTSFVETPRWASPPQVLAHRSGMGPQICISNKLPVDADSLGWSLALEVKLTAMFPRWETKMQ